MSAKQQGERILIGRGRLTWDPSERISDRYGFVHLLIHGDSTSTGTLPAAEMLVRSEHIDQRVILLAVILETRQSTHIGDLCRGVFPSTPNVGDVITFGVGLLTVAHVPEIRVGVRPFDDDRETDWMDIKALYRCHEQTVALEYEVIE